ncbi:J domain-containing protein [Salmonella enterica]
MKTCWQILGIESTTDIDVIRQAYLALLPSFHPETDPQGFKQLREAYENALQEAKSPAAPAIEQEQDPDMPWVNSLLAVFRDLLTDGERRFQPQAWQEFIQQLNKLSLSQVEKARWPLCAVAMSVFPVSYPCLKLLSDRLAWERKDANDEIDEEELENFLADIRFGNLFDYSTLLHLPVEVQNQTINFYDALERTFFDNIHYFTQLITLHGAWIIPDDARFQRRLLRWFSTLHWGIEELLPIAYAWQQAEPRNDAPRYYALAQRVYCGEGDSLLFDLSTWWQEFPSTQLDDLLLRWCRRHYPDDVPLLLLANEMHEQIDINGNPLIYILGSSAVTRLLWADALHSGKLSPLSECFIAHQLDNSAPPIGEEYRQHPKWPLYQIADILTRGDVPDESQVQFLTEWMDNGDLGTTEGLITLALLTLSESTIALHSPEKTMEDSAVQHQEPIQQEEASSASHFGIWQIIKIIFFIGLAGHLLSKFMH